ncbi:MAG TPA: aminoglycoside phosphotransferase family protein [Roseiflexaceae bacterium]
MNPDIVNTFWDGGLAGVRWALLDPQPHEALRQALAALLPDAALLGPCRLNRAKFKPGRKLSAYYDATVRDAATGESTVRPIEVIWQPPDAQTRPEPPPELAAMQAEAVERGLAAPFDELLTKAPEWGMRVQISPLDARFPQLVRVSDPSYVRDMLAGANLAHSPDARYRVTTIRYRPGQRHVLRYDPADGSRSGAPLFAKIYNSDKGARTFDVVTRAADWLAAHGGGLTTVRPAAYIADDGVVLYPLVSGTPLSELLRTPDQQAASRLRQAGVALAALHGTPTDVVELQPHSFAKEIKGIVSASEHVHPLLPATGALIDVLLDRARALHERLPQEPPAFAYGDFKADHLWVTPDGLTLIDFDTCYLFDPAIDVGKFLADLQWWYNSYGQPGVEQAQEQFLAGYAPGATAERLLRARLYEALVLIKTTVRRVRLFDQNWAERTEQLIRRADAVLTQLDDV